MIKYKKEFEYWWNNHSQLPDGGLATKNSQDPEKEYYFHTTTKMAHDLFVKLKDLENAKDALGEAIAKSKAIHESKELEKSKAISEAKELAKSKAIPRQYSIPVNLLIKQIEINIEFLILATPTSEFRDKLTEINILFMEALGKQNG